MHNDNHPLAGQTIIVHPKGEFENLVDGAEFHLENWWDHPSVFGSSWMTAQGNPAAMHYAIRNGVNRLPLDNNVVYGKINGLGYLVHTSELEESAVLKTRLRTDV